MVRVAWSGSFSTTVSTALASNHTRILDGSGPSNPTNNNTTQHQIVESTRAGSSHIRIPYTNNKYWLTIFFFGGGGWKPATHSSSRGHGVITYKLVRERRRLRFALGLQVDSY